MLSTVRQLPYYYFLVLYLFAYEAFKIKLSTSEADAYVHPKLESKLMQKMYIMITMFLRLVFEQLKITRKQGILYKIIKKDITNKEIVWLLSATQSETKEVFFNTRKQKN